MKVSFIPIIMSILQICGTTRKNTCDDSSFRLQDSLSVTQLYNLDQFLMQGGKLVVLADKIFSDSETVIEIHSNLFDFPENNGIKIKQ